MDMVRVVFLGSPQFAVPSLEALLDATGIEVPLVVTQPDRRAGRGRKLQPPPVKVIAESRGVEVVQPESMRGPEIDQTVRQVAPDVLVVVSYGEILRRNILELSPCGCLNVHPSLLPAYRGSIPVQATILNGDAEAGVSIMKLGRRMDAGPILARYSVPTDGTETTGDLTARLSELAAVELPDVVRRWVRNEIPAIPQEESSATYTRELRKSDAQIDWSWTAQYIERFVRAMRPWPIAWTLHGDARLIIDRVRIVGDHAGAEGSPGTLRFENNEILVQSGDGPILIEAVQPPGKRVMSAREWARGLQAVELRSLENPTEEPPPLIFRRETSQ